MKGGREGAKINFLTLEYYHHHFSRPLNEFFIVRSTHIAGRDKAVNIQRLKALTEENDKVLRIFYGGGVCDVHSTGQETECSMIGDNG